MNYFTKHTRTSRRKGHLDLAKVLPRSRKVQKLYLEISSSLFSRNHAQMHRKKRKKKMDKSTKHFNVRLYLGFLITTHPGRSLSMPHFMSTNEASQRFAPMKKKSLESSSPVFRKIKKEGASSHETITDSLVKEERALLEIFEELSARVSPLLCLRSTWFNQCQCQCRESPSNLRTSLRTMRINVFFCDSPSKQQ